MRRESCCSSVFPSLWRKMHIGTSPYAWKSACRLPPRFSFSITIICCNSRCIHKTSHSRACTLTSCPRSLTARSRCDEFFFFCQPSVHVLFDSRLNVLVRDVFERFIGAGFDHHFTLNRHVFRFTVDCGLFLSGILCISLGVSLMCLNLLCFYLSLPHKWLMRIESFDPSLLLSVNLLISCTCLFHQHRRTEWKRV